MNDSVSAQPTCVVLRLDGGEGRREAIHSYTGTPPSCASLGRAGDEPPPGPEDEDGDKDGDGKGQVMLRMSGERGVPALWDEGPGRAIGVEGADQEREADNEADGDDRREAGCVEAEDAGGQTQRRNRIRLFGGAGN